jgi:hypothetical protein
MHLSNKRLLASMGHTRVHSLLFNGSLMQILSSISRVALIPLRQLPILRQRRLGQLIMLNSNSRSLVPAILNIARVDRDSLNRGNVNIT